MIPWNTSFLSCYLVSWRLLPYAIFIAFKKWRTVHMWVVGWLMAYSHFCSLWQEWQLSHDTVHCEPTSTYPSKCFLWPRFICCWINDLPILPYITSELYAMLSWPLNLLGCSIPVILTCRVKVGAILAATGICALSLCWFVIDGV